MHDCLLKTATTVCVTGGAGFIGKWLVRRLLADGHSITVLDDLSSGSQLPAPAPSLRFVRGSVLDRAAIDDASCGAQLLVHLAGTVGMRQVNRDRDRSYLVSVEGTRLLLERTPGVPVVLASSSAVYGHRKVAVVHEGLGVDDASVLDYDGGTAGYATGKWHLEELGRAAKRPVLCVRPFNVVGQGQISTWGMVIPSFVEHALANEPLQVYDDGLQTRSFSEVQTFADTMVRAISCLAAWQLADRTLNVGTAQSTSILDLAQLVVARTNSTSTLLHRPYAEVFPGMRDVRERVPDTTRLHRLLGPVHWPGIDSIVDDVIKERRQ